MFARPTGGDTCPSDVCCCYRLVRGSPHHTGTVAYILQLCIGAGQLGPVFTLALGWDLVLNSMEMRRVEDYGVRIAPTAV